jgi:DNA-directed RNA polymerase subunit N (RpoN/RPB10)
MIIPIKCFTCGTILADKYEFYLEKVAEFKKTSTEVQYFSEHNTAKTIEGRIMDELKLNKPCCRRHMLTHVDIE